jgi:hypothetical protein
VGGKFHPKLNICGRPIANKYREGKMKRTLKRESKVLEIAEIEGMASSIGLGIYSDEGSVMVGLELAFVFSVRLLAGFEFVLSSSLGQDGFLVV